MTAPKLPAEVESAAPGETEEAGRELAASLRAGDIVFFKGDVGAGKSTMIRAAMRELGVTGAIPSPTFTIGRRYSGRVPVSHLDLYRVGSIEEEDPGLLSDYFGPDRIVFVEWPESAEAGFARSGLRHFEVRLAHGGGDRRSIVIAQVDPATD